MKTCVGCQYAVWKRTKAGRLHPSGDGRCAYEYKIPALPASMYFIHKPTPCGGLINRHKGLTKPCAYWTSPQMKL